MVDMSALVGTVRRLGMAGPPYEVLGPTGPSASGETQVRIYLIESGEEVEHSLEQVLADPLDD